MAIFQSKVIQSTIFLIIVLVVILWVLRDNVLSISLKNKPTEESLTNKGKIENISYIEKIDNFIIKEYSKDKILLHTIQADVYKSYKDSPVQLENVKVKIFDEFKNETLILKSNTAEILNSGSIHFIGEVEIKTLSGISHEIDTELLIANDDKISSNKDVFYKGEKIKIKAQGMDMNIESDILNLNGNVEIVQENGSTLNTLNLLISHSLGEKKYASEGQTLYQSKENTLSTDKGFDINMSLNQTKLLGSVKGVNGFGSSITSNDLVIDQSNGGEIFKSNSPSRFQSSTVDIRAGDMHYDTVAKKLKLTDGVLATYE